VRGIDHHLRMDERCGAAEVQTYHGRPFASGRSLPSPHCGR
jgi:hypothetical protein